MKTRNFILIFVVAICAVMFLADAPGWADKPEKPPKVKPTPVPGDEDPPDNPVDGFWYWRWGHMDGPHDSSKALGISRDGTVAVGSTVVVDFDPGLALGHRLGHRHRRRGAAALQRASGPGEPRPRG